MKRKELEKRLRELGYIIRNGSKHNHILDMGGHHLSVFGKHAELHEQQIRLIERQLGVKLLP